MDRNDIEMIDNILRNGNPEMATSRVNDYIRGREMDGKDFQIVLGRVNLFLYKEIQRNRKREILGKVSVAVSCLALGLASLALILSVF